MTFRNPILGGNGELIRQNIHSENYVPGVAGWQITRDGDAEFNNVTTRGELYVGDSNQYMRAYVAPSPINGPALVFNDDAAHVTDGYIRAVPLGPNGANSTLFMSAPYAAGESPSQLSLVSGSPSPHATLSGDFEVNGKFDVAPSAGHPVFLADSAAGVQLGTALDPVPVSINGNRLDGPWDPFTPVWSASTTNPTLGNAVRRARWKMIGTKTALFAIRYVFGTTTVFGSGAWGFTLPFTPLSITEQAATAWCVDDSASSRIACSAVITAASGVFRVLVPTGGVGVSSTVPFTWAANDTISISGAVELD